MELSLSDVVKLSVNYTAQGNSSWARLNLIRPVYSSLINLRFRLTVRLRSPVAGGGGMTWKNRLRHMGAKKSQQMVTGAEEGESSTFLGVR